jgi:hypothetical protein
VTQRPWPLAHASGTRVEKIKQLRFEKAQPYCVYRKAAPKKPWGVAELACFKKKAQAEREAKRLHANEQRYAREANVRCDEQDAVIKRWARAAAQLRAPSKGGSLADDVRELQAQLKQHLVARRKAAALCQQAIPEIRNYTVKRYVRGARTKKALKRRTAWHTQRSAAKAKRGK